MLATKDIERIWNEGTLISQRLSLLPSPISVSTLEPHTPKHVEICSSSGDMDGLLNFTDDLILREFREAICREREKESIQEIFKEHTFSGYEKEAIEQVVNRVEKNRLIVDYLLFSPKSVLQIKQSATSVQSTSVNSHTHPHQGTIQPTLTGIFGHIWGYNIGESRNIPNHEIYAMAAPEYLGYRYLEKVSFHNGIKLKICYAVVNPKAVSFIVIK